MQPDPSAAHTSSAHMSNAEFPRYGHQLVDWVADYWAGLAQLPVTPRVVPGQISAQLADQPPDRGERFADVLRDLDSVVVPGLTHWQHPSYFAYFPANTSGPSVLADLVAAGIGAQGMLWVTGPVCTEMETRMLDWLAQLLGLPAKFRSSAAGGGVIQDSASSATLVATLVALHRASGGRWRTDGIDQSYCIYTSTQGHSSIEKAARLAGLGDGALRSIEVDPKSLAMQAPALRDAMAADRAAGRIPALVVATVGTTSTTAVDPILHIGQICREYGAWLHVDAAYAGAAAVCPELRWSHDGVEYADSYCFDPHKWLLTGLDCDAFWVADRAELIQALSVLPEYLRNAASQTGAVIDYRDWQVPLGRRFRALKLWFVLRWYGVEGLREHIRSGIGLAQQFAGWVAEDERFEVVAPHPFSTVCWRLRGGDDANAELLRRLNESGKVYLTHTKVNDQFTIRLAIGSPQTTAEHVAAAWELIKDTAAALAEPEAEPGPAEAWPGAMA